MADAMDALPEQVDAIEQKLDALAASVDVRFDAVDARFDAMDTTLDVRFGEVTAALVEQRQYTEFAFERLRGEMQAGFAETKNGFTAMTANFGRLERKLDRLIDRMLGPSGS